jgi:hypothetical protein
LYLDHNRLTGLVPEQIGILNLYQLYFNVV